MVKSARLEDWNGGSRTKNFPFLKVRKKEIGKVNLFQDGSIEKVGPSKHPLSRVRPERLIPPRRVKLGKKFEFYDGAPEGNKAPIHTVHKFER